MLRPDGIVLALLGRGCFFGERALLHDDLRRNCNVEALSICDIYSLDRGDLERVFEVAPTLREEMLKIVDTRDAFNQNIEAKLKIRVRDASRTQRGPPARGRPRHTSSSPALPSL